VILLIALAAAASLSAASIEIARGPVHLRSGSEREWNEFPATSRGAHLRVSFSLERAVGESTLTLRQRDVKNNSWHVRINGQNVGTLEADERVMRRALPVPASVLRAGENWLEIEGKSPASDDIELSEVRLIARPLREYARESLVHVETMTDGERLPVRITVADAQGVLVPLTALRSSNLEAVRTGVVYTADGIASIGLPAGEYEVFASRGFEYSAPSRRIRLEPGKEQRVHFNLVHEVKMEGFVSCDTHVHTYELSKHGDASLRERAITAAGEGLDIVVATEHNQTADYFEVFRRLGLDSRVLTVRGNEVTTAMGHFNIFPLAPGAVPPNSRAADWASLAKTLGDATGAGVIVQNHPRDLHAGYRPFDPANHVSETGESLIGRPFFANAVEVVNSGAMYSDILQPVRDWMGLLEGGRRVAAIGASDTHTVDFVPIGQARTYIDVRSLGPAWRDRPQEVFGQLARGENLVSYGLAVELVHVSVRASRLTAEAAVYGPSWSSADRLMLFAGGKLLIERRLPSTRAAGLKHRHRLEATVPEGTKFVVAVVTGPGIRRPFWEVRKPYQPSSRDWNPQVIGVSRAIHVAPD
jgi:hypothetical protein